MSYQALYRKFRPTDFDGCKRAGSYCNNIEKSDQSGQNRTCLSVLRNAEVPGKTTVAKIFAKAVNCEHPVDGSPCGELPDVQGDRSRRDP